MCRDQIKAGEGALLSCAAPILVPFVGGAMETSDLISFYLTQERMTYYGRRNHCRDWLGRSRTRKGTATLHCIALHLPTKLGSSAGLGFPESQVKFYVPRLRCESPAEFTLRNCLLIVCTLKVEYNIKTFERRDHDGKGSRHGKILAPAKTHHSFSEKSIGSFRQLQVQGDDAYPSLPLPLITVA